MDEMIIDMFIAQMREEYSEEIAAVELPEGTAAYLQACIDKDDVTQLEFVLRLAYVMGLQTGYAASVAETEVDDEAIPSTRSAIQA